MGTIGLTAYGGLLYIAASHTSGVNLSIIQGSIPVFVIAGGFIFLKVRTSAGALAGVALTIVGIFPSFVAQLFVLRGVALIGPGRAGLFINLVPVFGALLSVLIPGEQFETFHAVALVCVLGGIYLAERGRNTA